MNTDTYSDILELLHREVKPALGCTEPIAVAYAANDAMLVYGLDKNPEKREEYGSMTNIRV